jgi:hypothetical protein
MTSLLYATKLHPLFHVGIPELFIPIEVFGVIGTIVGVMLQLIDHFFNRQSHSNTISVLFLPILKCCSLASVTTARWSMWLATVKACVRTPTIQG